MEQTRSYKVLRVISVTLVALAIPLMIAFFVVQERVVEGRFQVNPDVVGGLDPEEFKLAQLDLLKSDTVLCRPLYEPSVKKVFRKLGKPEPEFEEAFRELIEVLPGEGPLITVRIRKSHHWTDDDIRTVLNAFMEAGVETATEHRNSQLVEAIRQASEFAGQAIENPETVNLDELSDEQRRQVELGIRAQKANERLTVLLDAKTLKQISEGIDSMRSLLAKRRDEVAKLESGDANENRHRELTETIQELSKKLEVAVIEKSAIDEYREYSKTLSMADSRKFDSIPPLSIEEAKASEKSR